MKTKKYRKIESTRKSHLTHTIDYLLECGHTVTRREEEIQPPVGLDGPWGETKLACPRCAEDIHD